MKEQDVYKDIGRRIRDAREDAKMAQEDLARFISVAPTTMSEIEKGKRKVTIVELQRLASFLNRSLVWFLTGEDTPTGKLRTRNGHLPAEAQKEIVDFIIYIFQKYGQDKPPEE